VNEQPNNSGYEIIGWHRKQRYGKSWLYYSDHIKTWSSKNLPGIFTVAPKLI